MASKQCDVIDVDASLFKVVCLMCRLVQTFQLSFILIILLYYRYIHFLFSNTPTKAKTVTSKQFERVKVLLERILSCLYEVLAEYRHISTVWAVSSLPDVVYLPVSSNSFL